MTDYIEKQAALNCFNDWIDKHGDVHTADEMVEYQRIEALPAAPVREVVLCKDCENYKPGEPPVGWCHAWRGATLEDAFCSFAERMGEA